MNKISCLPDGIDKQKTKFSKRIFKSTISGAL